MEGDTCKYDETRVTFDGGAEKQLDVDTAYLEAHSDSVATLLKMAGVRLGGVLNVLLGKEGEEALVAAPEISLREIANMRRVTEPAAAETPSRTGASTKTILERIRELENARDANQDEIERLQGALD
jgi:hypothetical protein